MTVRTSLAFATLLLVSAVPVWTAHAARHPFDVARYESWVRAHHRKDVPYTDKSGHVTAFATAWMNRRRLCGGAMTDIIFNPRTWSVLQEFQGCTAIERVDGPVIRFTPEHWIS